MGIVLTDVTLVRSGSTVVNSVSTVFAARCVTGLVGPNGSGKSTLLRAIYGYLECSSGQILIDKKPLKDWDIGALSASLGVCPQEAEPSLDFQVEQALSLRFGGNSDKVEERLNSFGFLRLKQLYGSRLSELSGGERQRVRLGQALLSGAQWLLLDEPANHLDLATGWALYEYLTHKVKDAGIIIALHDLNTAVRVCDQLVVLKEGRTVAQGAPCEVLTEALLADVFGLSARLETAGGSPSLKIEGVVGSGKG